MNFVESCVHENTLHQYIKYIEIYEILGLNCEASLDTIRKMIFLFVRRLFVQYFDTL